MDKPLKAPDTESSTPCKHSTRDLELVPAGNFVYNETPVYLQRKAEVQHIEEGSSINLPITNLSKGKKRGRPPRNAVSTSCLKPRTTQKKGRKIVVPKMLPDATLVDGNDSSVSSAINSCPAVVALQPRQEP